MIEAHYDPAYYRGFAAHAREVLGALDVSADADLCSLQSMQTICRFIPDGAGQREQNGEGCGGGRPE